MTTTSLVPISQEDKIAAVSGFQDRSLPIEQTCVWETFEKSQGHGVWGRYAWYEDDTKVAFITLYKYTVRGVHYLWAKWGPAWVKEASPEREAALRADLVREIKERDKSVVFVRLHAIYQHPDLVMPLQTISYDRTVVIDTSGKTEDAILASMPKSGKRSIRSGLKKGKAEGIIFHEDTANAAEVIDEYYAVMEETAERDGFRPHPKDYYMSLLTTLGPKHARIFSMRDADGNILCWDFCLVEGIRAQAEYGASTEAGRRLRQPPVLDFLAAEFLARDGVREFDLMGAHSPRCPELYSVGKYKSAFASHFTDVPGGWDMPIKKSTYRALSAAKAVKDWHARS